MSKRIEIDGKFYRRREGKLVEIPARWLGKTVAAQTIRKRPSKHIHKVRRRMKGWIPKDLLDKPRSGQF